MGLIEFGEINPDEVRLDEHDSLKAKQILTFLEGLVEHDEDKIDETGIFNNKELNNIIYSLIYAFAEMV